MIADKEISRKGRRLVDLTGKVFVRLTVISRAENSACGKVQWHCVCSCGTETVVVGGHLASGNTTSCGCLKNEASRARFTVLVDGAPSSGHESHTVWGDMVSRCTNPKAANYPRYGGRGIKVCQRWRESFSDFVSDVGPRPSPKHSIDRIDNDGHYEPGNVRWATRTEQGRNMRNNRYVLVDGVRLTLAAAAESFGLEYHQFHHFVHRNPSLFAPEPAR